MYHGVILIDYVKGFSQDAFGEGFAQDAFGEGFVQDAFGEGFVQDAFGEVFAKTSFYVFNFLIIILSNLKIENII